MHGTRTAAKILVGAAVVALAGCVTVDVPPTAPAPVAETVRPAQDVAPQVVEGPAREALEGVLPAPSSPALRPAHAPEPRRRAVAPPRSGPARPATVPPRREWPRPETLPALPGQLAPVGSPKGPPVSRADVCALGERHGGWGSGSDPARICRGVYGR